MKHIKVVFVLMLFFLIVMIVYGSFAEETSYIVEYFNILDERSTYHRSENKYDYLLNCISYPNKSIKCGPVEITVREVCADTKCFYSAITFALMEETPEVETFIGPMGPWIEEQFFAENQTVWLFYYEVNTFGRYLDVAFEYMQTNDHQWAQVDECIRHYPKDEYPVNDNQWIDVVFNITLQRIQGSQIDSYQCDIQMSYQVLPTLDRCEFHGEALFEKANYKLTDLSLFITPIDVYLEEESQVIDPDKESPPLYYGCFDDNGWNYAVGGYIDRLSDTLYFGYRYDDTDGTDETIVFAFARDGDTYVYQGIKND